MVSELLSLLQRTMDALRMMYVVILSLASIALGTAVFFIARMSLVFCRLRGPHEVLCPDDEKPAVIQMRAWHGAMTSVVDGPEGRIRSCSRWPEKSGCDQGCLREIPRLRHG
jgi:hypothetical protein